MPSHPDVKSFVSAGTLTKFKQVLGFQEYRRLPLIQAVFTRRYSWFHRRLKREQSGSRDNLYFLSQSEFVTGYRYIKLKRRSTHQLRGTISAGVQFCLQHPSWVTFTTRPHVPRKIGKCFILIQSQNDESQSYLRNDLWHKLFLIWPNSEEKVTIAFSLPRGRHFKLT